MDMHLSLHLSPGSNGGTVGMRAGCVVEAIRTRGTLNPTSKRNISSWSARFSPIYPVLPHPSILKIYLYTNYHIFYLVIFSYHLISSNTFLFSSSPYLFLFLFLSWTSRYCSLHKLLRSESPKTTFPQSSPLNSTLSTLSSLKLPSPSQNSMYPDSSFPKSIELWSKSRLRWPGWECSGGLGRSGVIRVSDLLFIVL